VRTPMEVGGNAFVEVRTASVALMLPAPAAPPTCSVETLLSMELGSANGVSVAVRGDRAVIAVSVWPGASAEHLRVFSVEPGSDVVSDTTFPREVHGLAFPHGDDVVVSAWEQGGGVRVHRWGSHVPPDGAVTGIDLPLGVVEAADGGLWVWHHHAMSEAGDPIAVLSHVALDGTITSTTGELFGAILGVVPDRDGMVALRTPLLGHHGEVVTLMRLDASLRPDRDVALHERVSALACPYYALDRGATEGRLGCVNGDTWLVGAYQLLPNLAFHERVLATTGSAAPIAVVDREDAIVVETFGGEITRFPRTLPLPVGAAVGADGSRIVVAWIEGADRDAPQRRLEVRRLDCTP
jgi:hypothetical protein